MWIADTAATVHTTPHSHGDKRKATREDSIMVGNGESESTSMIADIPGASMCDKYRNKLNKGTLKNVTLLPAGKFNLFSLSKMLKLVGWKMGGDDTEIWPSKSGDMNILFDIIIPTPKGSSYNTCMKRTGVIKNEMANASIDKMSIQTAHKRFGHFIATTLLAKQPRRLWAWT